MNRLTSILATALGLLVTFVCIGFFASVGLAVVGVIAATGAVLALVAGVRSLFAVKRDAAQTSA